MQYQYGATSPVAERPRCWSKGFDDGARECRGCGFQTSCKEEILRQSSRVQAPAPMSPAYFTPYAVPQTYSPPPIVREQVQQYQSPAQVQQFRGLQVQPQQVPTQQQRQMYQPPSIPFGYGWIQDPLYYTLSSAPPPVRPQMGDETFMGRVAKNAGLAMLEAMFGQCLLAVRQMVLPPAPVVVDVQPSAPTAGPPFRPQ